MLDLNEIPFFSQFSYVELEAVRHAIRLQEYSPGTALCVKGDTGRYLYAIASGGVKVLANEGQGFFHGPGHIIGELSLLSGLPISATVVATKPTKVYALDKSTLQELLDAKPELYRTFTELLASRVRRLPLDRSLEGPTCVIFAVAGGVADCYAFARSAFGRIVKYAPHSFYCQLRQAQDSATAAVAAGTGVSIPPFIKPLGELSLINDGLLGNNPGFQFDKDSLSPEGLIQDWRSFGCQGQCLVLAIPWAELKNVRPLLANHDAVLAVLPPDFAAELDSAPQGNTVGRADYLEVRLARGEQAAVSPFPQRWSFVIDIDGWIPGQVRSTSAVPTPKLDRLARWVTHRSIGISLGSGASRGFAHLGVLKVLEDAKIPIDCLSGTSIGGIVAIAYSIAGTADGAIELGREWLGKKSRVLDPFHRLGASLVAGRRIRIAAEAVFGSIQFSDLPKPVATVGTDLITGEKVVMEEGSTMEAALGTSAIPGFFPPVAWGNRILIDGANVSRVPVDLLDKYRCGAKIAVNVAPRPGSEVMDEKTIKKNFFSLFGFRNIWLRSWELQAYWHGTQEASHADIILEPDTRAFGMLEFDRFDELLEEGIRTASEKLEEIQAVVSTKLKPDATPPKDPDEGQS